MLKNARQADTGVKLEVNERYEGACTVLYMTVVALTPLSSGPPRRRGILPLAPVGKFCPWPRQPSDDSV